MSNRFYSWLAPLAICSLFASALLSSLGRLDFLDGVEHFNLATVQEMRRNEAAGQRVNWMLPTLQADARVVKPPLTAWITAILITPDRAAMLATADDARRAELWEQFVFLARLPTLFCACLLLLGVYVLGRTLGSGDWRVGAAAALICAGTVLYFTQARRSTTDLQLALWVTWTNVFLAVAIFTPRRWLGWCGGGVMLGLASMAKGPHIALLLTVVPLGLYLALNRSKKSADASNGSSAGKPAESFAVRMLPVLVGIVLAMIVGLWWYAYVAVTVPGIGEVWWREVTRKDAAVGRGTLMADDPWYDYLMVIPALLPWTPWVVLGGIWAVLLPRQPLSQSEPPAQPSPGVSGEGADATLIDARWCFDARRQVLCVLWFLLPILVMSCFAEKKSRYLVPLITPAAVLAGWAIVRWWDARASTAISRRDRIAGVVTLLASAGAAGGLAFYLLYAGTKGLKNYRTFEDQPWFDLQFAVMAGGAIGLLLIAGLRRTSQSLLSPMLAITVVAWLGAEMKMRGQASSPGDKDDLPQRHLAATIWHRWPTAKVYCAEPVTLYGQLNKPAIVLSMELSRVIDPKPATLPSTPGPEPLILITDRVGEVPPVAPGWQRFDQVPLRTGTRYVDVLDSPAR